MSINNEYQKEIEKVWNEKECLVDKSTAISHEKYLEALDGKIAVSLAGAKVVPEKWFPILKNKSVLGLASGGGQQGPVFAAQGAKTTIMDISERQIENEKYVAKREGYDIRIIKGDMSKPLPFEDEEFDFIFNPISNCYIAEIQPLWNECARIVKKGGILMMAFVKEEHFLFEPDFKNEDFLVSRHTLPFNPLTDLTEEQIKMKIENHMPLAFSHTLTEQIGGLIKAGFELTDIYEDCDGGGLFDKYMNSYVCVRAVKK